MQWWIIYQIPCTTDFIIIGASLSEPHLVRSMAWSAMYVRRTFNHQIFAVPVHYNFARSGMWIVHKAKMASIHLLLIATTASARAMLS